MILSEKPLICGRDLYCKFIMKRKVKKEISSIPDVLLCIATWSLGPIWCQVPRPFDHGQASGAFVIHSNSQLFERLLVQPDLVEVLVEVMAWCDLPALHIGTVRVDLVPPIGDGKVRLPPREHALLKLAQHCACFRRIAFAVHLIIQPIKRTIDAA